MESYKDKHASLIVFGIFELLGGGFCAFLSLISLLSFSLAQDDLGAQAYAGILVYLVLAGWLITMGIGTLRARRWAQRLMLAANWLLFVGGILGAGMLAFILPKTMQTIPSEARGLALMLVFGTMALFYFVFPGIGILFYGNRNVRATFEQRDETPSWTEHCPLPVLILVVMLFFGILSLGSLVFMNFAMPFFGTIVSGWTGSIVLFVMMCACILLTVGVYQLRMAAWWGAVVLIVLGAVSQWITYARIDVMDYYAAMGYSDQMLDAVRSSGMDQGQMFGWMAVFYAVPALVFLLVIKRFFNGEDKGEEYVGSDD